MRTIKHCMNCNGKLSEPEEAKASAYVICPNCEQRRRAQKPGHTPQQQSVRIIDGSFLRDRVGFQWRNAV